MCELFNFHQIGTGSGFQATKSCHFSAILVAPRRSGDRRRLWATPVLVVATRRRFL
jgi:hypothetical protein